MTRTRTQTVPFVTPSELKTYVERALEVIYKGTRSLTRANDFGTTQH